MLRVHEQVREWRYEGRMGQEEAGWKGYGNEWMTERVCAKRMKMAVWAHKRSTGDGQSDGQANG